MVHSQRRPSVMMSSVVAADKCAMKDHPWKNKDAIFDNIPHEKRQLLSLMNFTEKVSEQITEMDCLPL